jgi:hypothetical protein
MSNECMKTLNPGWHAARRDTRDLGHIQAKLMRGFIAVGYVGLMGSLVGGCQLRLFG